MTDEVITINANNKIIKSYKMYDNYNNFINVKGIEKKLGNDKKSYFIGLENTDKFNKDSTRYKARTCFTFYNKSIEDIKILRFGKIKITFDGEYGKYIGTLKDLKIGKNKFYFSGNSVEVKFKNKLRYNEVYKYARIIKYLYSYLLGYRCFIVNIDYFIKDNLICNQCFSKDHVFKDVINSIRYEEKKEYIKQEELTITRFAKYWIEFLSNKYAVCVLNSLEYVYSAYSYEDLEKQIQETVILMDGFFKITCDEYAEYISSKIYKVVKLINSNEKNKKINNKIIKLLNKKEISYIVDIRGAKSHAGEKKKEYAKELRKLLTKSMFTLEIYILISVLENKNIDTDNNKKRLKKINKIDNQKKKGA